MSIHFRDLAVQTAADGTISPEEILILRRAGWADGRIDAEEAEAILAVNHRIQAHSLAWTDFFVEAIAESLLNDGPPLGEIDEAKADWLMARIARDGRIGSLAELELLAKLFERSAGVPDRLRGFALAQIEASVLSGDGPTRQGAADDAGIGDTEARLLRRLIFAPASGRAIGVSRAEAEMLLRLKDKALDMVSSADWQRLFVQGLGNYLAAFTLHQPFSHERAAELEEIFARPTQGIGRFFARMLHWDSQTGFTRLFGRPAETPVPTSTDTDRPVDAYEQALMDFLADDGPR